MYFKFSPIQPLIDKIANSNWFGPIFFGIIIFVISAIIMEKIFKVKNTQLATIISVMIGLVAGLLSLGGII